jgi:predicted transposase/invertase (TIGR01784 family)
MQTEHEPGVQVVKTLEIARKITDIDNELKDSVLGMLIVLADKFIDNQDLKNKVIDVIKMEITILHDYVTSHEQKWLEEGKLEGKVEGKEEGKLEIAKNMQKENYPIKEIAKITKLDYKTIEKLK